AGAADDELAAVATAIDTMAAELGRHRSLERAFLMSISHDLRTPLTSIRGYAEAVAEGAADDEESRRRAAEIIGAGARRPEGPGATPGAPGGGTVEIGVADDGPGIDPEDLPRVFERLYTSRRQPGRKVGTGLGLAIVRELVSAMGGSVGVDRTPAGGTRFVVTLAAAPPEATRDPRQGGSTSWRTTSDGSSSSSTASASSRSSSTPRPAEGPSTVWLSTSTASSTGDPVNGGFGARLEVTT